MLTYLLYSFKFLSTTLWWVKMSKNAASRPQTVTKFKFCSLLHMCGGSIVRQTLSLSLVVSVGLWERRTSGNVELDRRADDVEGPGWPPSSQFNRWRVKRHRWQWLTAECRRPTGRTSESRPDPSAGHSRRLVAPPGADTDPENDRVVARSGSLWRYVPPGRRTD